MKANDKQIEALLRRHAQRSKAASAAEGFAHLQPARAAAAVPHLNADELNAFASGALSDAGRSRYVTHLAECDRCRALATQITLAAGAALERHRAAQAKASWLSQLRENLADLLAPRAWRYLAPVLVLVAVAGFVFVALRHQREAELVAQNRPQSESLPAQSGAPELAVDTRGAYAQPAERARASKEQAKPGTTGSAAPKTAADRAVSKPGAAPEEQAAVAQNTPRQYSPPPDERAAEQKEEESKKTQTEPYAASKAEPSTEPTRVTRSQRADESAKEE